MKSLSDGLYSEIITTIAQLDYGYYHRDGDCLEAAAINAKRLLKLFGEKIAEEEAEEED